MYIENRFQYSMQIKKAILENPELCEKIKSHFLKTKVSNDFLGSGNHNLHYRLGKLEFKEYELWLATRETKQTNNRKKQKRTLERFCQGAASLNSHLFGPNIQTMLFEIENTHPACDIATTSFTIGVRFKLPHSNSFGYSLIVEDLTAGGKIQYKPEHDGMGNLDHDSMIEEKTNALIYFDGLEEGENFEGFKFMKNETVLTFE